MKTNHVWRWVSVSLLLVAFNAMASGETVKFKLGGEEVEMLHYELDEADVLEPIEVSEKGKKPTMKSKLRAYDPINKVSYEKAIAGPVYVETSLFANYHVWRYVTVYDVHKTSERVAYLPYFEEECHDNSFFMAEWGESRSFKVTLKSDLGFSKLGLSASVGMSIEQGTTFSSSRRIKATEGIRARHYPVKLSDTYEGITYIQTYNTKTKKYGYLVPNMLERAFDTYPYDFYLDNQNIGFKADREVLEYCPGYSATNDGPSKSETDLFLGTQKK